MMHNMTNDQWAAVTLRGSSLLCTAAAGAGKTRVLVERVVSYVTDPDHPAHVDDFLLITFTRAAAGEMRSRIAERLHTLCAGHRSNTHLHEQLRRVYTAKICTLDAYCREILMENAVAAGLPAGFRVGDESEMALLQESALEEALDELYDMPDGDERQKVALLLDTFGDIRGDAALSAVILNIWKKTRCHPNPDAWLSAHTEQVGTELADWCQILLEWAADITESYRAAYEDILPDLQNDPVACVYLNIWSRDTDAMDSLIRKTQAGWDPAVDFTANHTFPQLPRVKTADKNDMCARFAELRKRWKKSFEKLEERISGTLADHQADLQAVNPLLQGLYLAVRLFDRRLALFKERRGVADFADIEHKTYHLLTQDGKPTELASRYATRFREIMVDEYQDINPLQNALIDALSQKGENVFYVGDVRQSIYRFQMAQPALFLQKERQYSLYNPDQPRPSGPCRVMLRENFRSRPEILDAVNQIFSRIDCPEMGALEKDAFMTAGKTFPPPSEPPVEWLTYSAKEGEETQAAEARAVAQRLRGLVDSGQARAGDCVILMRSPRSRTAYFRKALEAVGLTCLSPGGQSYFEQPEILTALSLLQVTDNPLNDIPLLSVLRSPIVGMTPDELVQMRLQQTSGSLFASLLKDNSSKGTAFRARLKGWRMLASELPPFELCARMLADTGLPGLYEEPARSRLLQLPGILSGYGGNDLKGLIQWFEQMGKADTPVSALTVEAANAVTIMSIHKSKGLQFPVVVVAALNKKFNTDDTKGHLLCHPDRGLGAKRRDQYSEYPTLGYRALQTLLDREMRSEELRLLYVAMTRAEKKLILSGAVLPDTSPRMVSRGELTLAPRLSEWLLKTVDINWTFFSGDNPFVLPSAPQATAPQTAVPLVIPPYAHAAAVDCPAKLTATGLAEHLRPKETEKDTEKDAEKAFLPPLTLPRLSQEERSLSPAEKGTALHLFMQYARYESCLTDKDARGELARLEALAYLTPRQAKAVKTERVAAFFQTESGKQLLNAKQVYREQKFSLLVGAGDIPGLSLPPGEKTLLQGIIDCTYETDQGLHLLDFKTDYLRPGTEAEAAERHRPQMDAYGAALQAIYPQKVLISREIVFFSTGSVFPL